MGELEWLLRRSAIFFFLPFWVDVPNESNFAESLLVTSFNSAKGPDSPPWLDCLVAINCKVLIELDTSFQTNHFVFFWRNAKGSGNWNMTV